MFDLYIILQHYIIWQPA